MTALPLSIRERGRQLFAATGCATCHAKLDDAAFVGWKVVRVGPDLTDRSYSDEWLAAKIRDPGQFAASVIGDRMPTLGVSESHLTALVHYINGGQATTVTSSGTLGGGS